MNKEIKQIGIGVLGGAVVRGVGGIFPATTNPKLVHGCLALASGIGAWKVTNPDLKAALIGGAVIKGLDFVKAVFEPTTTAQTLTAKTDMMSSFLKGATGLGCPADENGLGAVMLGSDGKYYEYDESGLQGTYIDENGQVIHVDEALNGSEDYIFADEDGLNGSEMDEEYALMGANSEFDVI